MAPPWPADCSSPWRSDGTPSCFRQPKEGVAVPARPGNPLRQLAQRPLNLAAIPKAPREHFHSRHRQRRSPRKERFFFSDKLSPPRHCPGVNLTGIAPFLWLRFANLLALAWPLRDASLCVGKNRISTRPLLPSRNVESPPQLRFRSDFSAAALCPHPFPALRPFWQGELPPPTRLDAEEQE
jgi:hypothetical protein